MLGAYVGFPAFEIPQVQPQHIKTSENGAYRLRVQEGKATSGKGVRLRDTCLPDRVGRSLQQFQSDENITPEPLN